MPFAAAIDTLCFRFDDIIAIAAAIDDITLIISLLFDGCHYYAIADTPLAPCLTPY